MKKIFTILITAVVMVIIGAAVINIVVPNAFTYMAGSIEKFVNDTTGLEWDINGDGKSGLPDAAVQEGKSDESYTGAGVDGFN